MAESSAAPIAHHGPEADAANPDSNEPVALARASHAVRFPINIG